MEPNIVSNMLGRLVFFGRCITGKNNGRKVKHIGEIVNVYLRPTGLNEKTFPWYTIRCIGVVPEGDIKNTPFMNRLFECHRDQLEILPSRKHEVDLDPEQPLCKFCGDRLDDKGFCTDLLCSYNERLQNEESDAPPHRKLKAVKCCRCGLFVDPCKNYGNLRVAPAGLHQARSDEAGFAYPAESLRASNACKGSEMNGEVVEVPE